MKVSTIFLAFIFLIASGNTHAQLLKKIKKNTEKSVERKLERKVQKETDKAIDSLLDGNKKQDRENDQSVLKEDNKEVPNENVLIRGNTENSNEKSANQNEVVSIKDETQAPDKSPAPDLKPWSKYNFVPGNKIIFQDDLVGEENGEFPSRWDLIQGNAENASMGGENIINLDNRAIVGPLMKQSNYLPDVFTIEFDAYFAETASNWQNYRLRFWPGSNHLQPQKNERYDPVFIQNNGATFRVRWEGNIKKYESFENAVIGNPPTWKHIAIAFNQRSMKVFIDQHRVLNIPNLKLKPQMFSVEAYTHKEEIRAIKNIRIAEGGKALYDQVLADGKFVTRGILFDVNKATIKPGSMGVINEVAKMMEEHPHLKFNIEGHTDSDGNDDYNQRLSEQRAAAVKEALINSGISETRMQTTGRGESVPVNENITPEDKANNRRVEFIKI